MCSPLSLFKTPAGSSPIVMHFGNGRLVSRHRSVGDGQQDRPDKDTRIG
jgi:hypothetical protein